MLSKYFYLALLLHTTSLFVSAVFGSENELYIPLHITSILKDCSDHVTIHNDQYCAEINLQSNSSIRFEKPFAIPFLSIVDYMKEYMQAAHGEPFVAQGSLQVKIGDQKFGIWENEMGIMCSSSFPNKSFIKLMKNVNKRGRKQGSAVAKALCYLISINKQGEMVLGNATTD